MPKGWHGLTGGAKRALSVVAIATVAGLLAPGRLRAAEPADSFDDPKLARELPAAPPVVAPASPVRAPVAAAAAPAKAAPVARPNGGVVAPPAVASTPPKAPAVVPAPAKAPVAEAPAPAKVPAVAAAPETVPAAPVAPPPVAAETAPVAAPVATAPIEPSSVPAPVAAPVAAAPAEPASPPAAIAAPVPAAAAPAPPEAAPSPPATSGTADLTAKARPPEPPAPAIPSGPWPYHPRLKLGYRWFSFARMPAAGSTAPTASETFQSVSLDAYPTSSYLRIGFSSQFGWESGQFQRTGDYFLAESASTGFQLPGRFTPFLEGLAGAGYMRRLQAGVSSSTGYYQLGVDGGVEIYLAKRAYVSIALGYLHPGNLFLQQKNLSGINADTWSLKFGLGI